MPYETTIESFEDYVRAEVSGDRIPGREVNDATQAGRKMSAACRDYGANKLLVIFKMTGRLGPIEAYEIFSNPEDYGWSRDVKVAIVDENPESQEDSTFSETVAVNRAYDMRVFDNEIEAKVWLLEV